MSGSRTKKLRRQAAETGIQLLAGGWRRLKRTWTRTPRLRRQDWDPRKEIMALRRRDEDKVMTALSKLNPAQLRGLRKELHRVKNDAT